MDYSFVPPLKKFKQVFYSQTVPHSMSKKNKGIRKGSKEHISLEVISIVQMMTTMKMFKMIDSM